MQSLEFATSRKTSNGLEFGLYPIGLVDNRGEATSVVEQVMYGGRGNFIKSRIYLPVPVRSLLQRRPLIVRQGGTDGAGMISQTAYCKGKKRLIIETWRRGKMLDEMGDKRVWRVGEIKLRATHLLSSKCQTGDGSFPVGMLASSSNNLSSGNSGLPPWFVLFGNYLLELYLETDYVWQRC